MDTDDLTPLAYATLSLGYEACEPLRAEIGAAAAVFNTEDEFLHGMSKFMEEILSDTEDYLDSWNLLDEVDQASFTDRVRRVQEHIAFTLKTPQAERGSHRLKSKTANKRVGQTADGALCPHDPGQGMMERANGLRAKGRLSAAEALYRRALDLRRQVYGPSHHLVAHSMNFLANVLYEQERYKEAEPLYRDSLTMRKRTLGREHREVAASLSNLANLLQGTKRYSEAERFYRQSLKLRKKVYGSRHPNVAMCMMNLAILMQTTGRNAQAEALFEGALRLLRSRLGAVHELTAYTESNLAEFLLTTGRPEEALPLAEHARGSLRATLPAGHRYNRWAREVLKRAKARRES